MYVSFCNTTTSKWTLATPKATLESYMIMLHQVPAQVIHMPRCAWGYVNVKHARALASSEFVFEPMCSLHVAEFVLCSLSFSLFVSNIAKGQGMFQSKSLSVKFFSKNIKFIFGYFNPISIFFDDKNKYFSG